MLDIKTKEDKNKKLMMKDYNRPDIIAVKQTELEKFMNYLGSNRKDGPLKQDRKKSKRLCTMGNSSEEFSNLKHVVGTLKSNAFTGTR